MPSPGIPTIQTDIAYAYTVEGGFPTNFSTTGTTNTKLATALHNGWTSATPITPTQMESEIITEFTGYVATSGPFGTGWEHLRCIGIGIDQEIDAWVASWDGDLMIHTYTVNAPSIYSRIITCYPWNSVGSDKLAEAVANMFASHFVQEVG